jgi:hypothetical protein
MGEDDMEAYYQNCTPQTAGKVGSFWWRDVCKLLTNFRGISICTPGDGKSILFWKDRWSDGLLAENFDRLFSFVIDPDVTLGDFLKCTNETDLLKHFAIPLSLQAYNDLLQVKNLLSNTSEDSGRVRQLPSFQLL